MAFFWGVCCFRCVAQFLGLPEHHIKPNAKPRYEDFSDTAAWMGTCAMEDPWPSPPSILELWHNSDDPASVFKFDVWHNYHGGAGKNFISSSYVELLNTFKGNSIDNKVDLLGDDVHEFCLRAKVKLYAGRVTRSTLGCPDLQVCPDACWSKFDDTRIMKPSFS